MVRVNILISKLQEQFLQKSSAENMLITAELLRNELLFYVNETTVSGSKSVSVVVPNGIAISAKQLKNELAEPDLYKPVPAPENEPAPVAEPMPEPESPLPENAPLPTARPEPEPIPHFVEQKPWLTVFPPKEDKKTPWALDPVLDIPTLAHQEKIVYELNDTMMKEGAFASINDKLKQNKSELSSALHETPIRDLKKAVSINDRHRFIYELFRDDENMYERSIKTINGFHILAEAEYWIQRELKLKLGWDIKAELVKTFDQLVRRRFS